MYLIFVMIKSKLSYEITLNYIIQAALVKGKVTMATIDFFFVSLLSSTLLLLACRWAQAVLQPSEDIPPAVRGVKVFHRAGQTFIAWQEEVPITSETIAEADFLGEVAPLSRYNCNARNVEYLIGRAMCQPDEAGELFA